MGTGVENRITAAVASAQRDGRKMFVPYLTAGFPDRSRTVDLVLALAAGGADIVEPKAASITRCLNVIVLPPIADLCLHCHVGKGR